MHTAAYNAVKYSRRAGSGDGQTLDHCMRIYATPLAVDLVRLLVGEDVRRVQTAVAMVFGQGTTAEWSSLAFAHLEHVSLMVVSEALS